MRSRQCERLVESHRSRRLRALAVEGGADRRLGSRPDAAEPPAAARPRPPRAAPRRSGSQGRRRSACPGARRIRAGGRERRARATFSRRSSSTSASRPVSTSSRSRASIPGPIPRSSRTRPLRTRSATGTGAAAMRSPPRLKARAAYDSAPASSRSAAYSWRAAPSSALVGAPRGIARRYRAVRLCERAVRGDPRFDGDVRRGRAALDARTLLRSASIRSVGSSSSGSGSSGAFPARFALIRAHSSSR